VGIAVRALRQLIAELHVAQQEDPFPGDQDVVEEDDRVHLFEA
jgi:hypothetical protein